MVFKPEKAKTVLESWKILNNKKKVQNGASSWHFAVRLLSGIFEKTLEHIWLCAGISPLLYRLRTWLKRQKPLQVL